MDEVVEITAKKRKMLPPEGCTSFSHGGRQFSMPRRDAKVPYVEAEEPIAKEMEAHGFLEWCGSVEKTVNPAK